MSFWGPVEAHARASLAEIAKRAGVSKGVISYHFAGKDELIEQVVLELYTRAGERIGARVEQAASSASALRGYLEANLAFIQGNPTYVRVLIDISMNFRTPDGRPRYDAEGAEVLLRHLEGILRSGQEAGEFRSFATAGNGDDRRPRPPAVSASCGTSPLIDPGRRSR